MNRRSFLYFGLGLVAIEFASGPILAIESEKLHEVQLLSNRVYLVQNKQTLKLPKNPIDGECVQIVVTTESLKHPAVLKSNKSRIINDNEPLILDSIANFKLTYHKQTNNWHFC